MTPRVLLVDDQAMVRQGLRLLLELGGLEVVGECEDGETAVAAARDLVPDVVLMDLRMPGIGGVEATRQIVDEGIPTKVVALTTFDADQNVADVLRAGAVGFLLKDVTADGLVEAVRRTVAGEPVVAPAVLARLMDHFAARPPVEAVPPPELAELSEREREVLAMIAAGRTNAEIADDLVISMATVKTHVRHIFAKLDLRDRAHAVVWAHDAGLRPRSEG
jgi:DNA-binding NarL/FixJ family response regulator